jgi:hypothetical protein
MQKTLRSRLYAPQPVNLNRQTEVDMGKFAMMFFLPFIHCVIECTSEEGLASGIPYLFDTIIGGPLSAPMYMFAMGIGMAYTKKSTPGQMAKRGLKLGLISYFFNICRFVIPFLVGFAVTGHYEKYIEPLMFRALGNDILQFAALAYLTMALLRKLDLPDAAMLGVGVVCSLAANFFNGCYVRSDLGNIFLGYLVGTEYPGGEPWIYSDFPLLNWVIVPICGYLFGKRLKCVKNKGMFYGIWSSICGAAALVYFALGIYFKFGMFGEGQNCYYHISTPDILAGIAAAIGMIGLYYPISKVLGKKCTDWISRVARNINAVYCIHWVLVSWIAIVLVDILQGSPYLPVGTVMVMGLGISLVSIFLSGIWSDRIKPRLKSKGETT